MKLRGTWLEAGHTQAVCAMLEAGGHRALFVGGCVRNALLGQPVADVDIATDAHPEQVLELAGAAGLRAVATGIDHGTITVVAGGEGHEVTTFRRDVETFGRHAVVAYSDRVEDDAARRDFTMNALYATREGVVLDPLGGGLADLQARRVRFVGDAQARIREDYLRILRFFRFHAWYGNASAGPDAEGLAACAENAAGVNALSRERIGHEMRRLLAAPDPAPSVAAMAQTGVLARLLPGADARALSVLIHLEEGCDPRWLRRLAVLGGDDAGPLWRLSKQEARDLAVIRAGLENAQGPGELGYRHGAALAADIVLARGAVLATALPEGWEAELARGAEARFPLCAADLMPGLQGPALGVRLRELEARWIASGFTLSREQLLA